MNRQHPYGGYDAGPNNRGHRPGLEGGGNHMIEKLPQAVGYYPPAGGPQHVSPSQQQAPYNHQQQQQQQQQQPSRYPPPPMSGVGQNEFQGGPGRDYREGGASYPPQHDFRGGSGPPQGMPPGASGGSRPALTLGPGPLNNQSQYGGAPMRFDGSGAPAEGAQSPALPLNPYGSASAPGGPPMRNVPPPMRQQGYDSHLPPKPDSAYASMPPQGSMASPPAHLPRPPGRDWGGDDQARKRARRDGSLADEGKDSDDIIKDRLKRERPCRTLFVRNVEFNADVADLRRRFEAFGEVKSYFDLTSKRGLLFISYHDLRSAEYAKASMQEFVVNGRKVDVHYSLPRESDMTKRCDRDKDQGTLFILLKRAQGELNDDEVRATFVQYGEIKSLRRYKDQGNCRFLEYYDHRACKAAHDAMIGATWNGGQWDIKFAWDAATPDRAPEPPKGPPQQNQGYGPMPTQGHQQQQQHIPQGGQPRWGGGPGEQYPAPPQSYGGAPDAPSAGYPPYGGPSAGRPDYAAPPAQGNLLQGTKRPFDHDDRGGQEPPMRRWGQAQSSGVPPPAPYGAGRPGEQGPSGPGLGAGPGPGYGPNRPPYSNQGGSGGQGYGEYGAASSVRNEYGQMPTQPQGNNSRWPGAPMPSARPPPPSGPAATGYGQGAPPQPTPQQQQQQQLAHGNHMPMQRPPPGAPSHQQGPAPPPSTDNRLEQAQKVQQLLASLKPGNLNQGPAPPTSAASPTPPPAASTTTAAPAAPSLPSNIAALLQMAQANAAKK